MSLLDAFLLAAIGERHLRLLIDTGVPESLDLEFKAILYGNSDGDRREFLKDVTALANTSAQCTPVRDEAGEWTGLPQQWR